jgi:hypothetical protein
MKVAAKYNAEIVKGISIGLLGKQKTESELNKVVRHEHRSIRHFDKMQRERERETLSGLMTTFSSIEVIGQLRPEWVNK